MNFILALIIMDKSGEMEIIAYITRIRIKKLLY